MDNPAAANNTLRKSKMKITKTQLKQIIKEELAVILTNEEAGELFGEAVEAELEEKKGIKNPGKYIDGPRTKAGIDDDGDGIPNKPDSHPKDGARNESMIQEDLGALAGLFQNIAATDLGVIFLAFAKAGLHIGSGVLVGAAMSKVIDFIRDGMEAKAAAREVLDPVKDAKQEGKSEQEILAMLDDLIKKN